MGKFAKASTQAASVIKALQKNGSIRSLGTARGYENALTRVAEYAKEERIQGGLRGMTPEQVHTYLEQRSEAVGQKQLDMERQAAQAMLQKLTSKLEPNQRLQVVQSTHTQILDSRSYTQEQVSLVAQAQQHQNSLSTQIAYAAGLRSHELLTLQKIEDRTPNDRPALPTKFQGRAGERYTVQGKGGLVREVRIPTHLAERLEAQRLQIPERVTDRGIHYAQHYKINAGQRWANSFSQASNRALGWTAGAHGLRHSYAQERMSELQRSGLHRLEALTTVSQELGHFRPEITEVYLR